jgi:putative nucleotidyltransferase with HDIG domain
MIRIKVADNEGERSSQLLDKAMIRVGRDPSNDVVVHDPYVSGRHGEVRQGPRGLVYEDLATTNGSRIRRAGEIIAVDASCGHVVALEEGDEILVGDSREPAVLRFEVTAAQVFSPRRGVLAPSRLGAPGGEMDATHAETLVLIPASLDRDVLLSLHRLTTRLAGASSEPEMARALAEAILDALPGANHVSAWVVDESRGEFTPVAAVSRNGPAATAPVSRAVKDRVLARGKALVFDLCEAGFDVSESLHDASVQSGMAAPLWDGHRVLGMVQADCRARPGHGRFGGTDLETLVVFAHQGAMALSNARLHENLRRSVEQAIAGLGSALEAKDRYTAGHSAAVAELCAAHCSALGLPADTIRTVRRAALLHDIGKIGIPYDVLNKTTPLSPDEFRQLRTHPEMGARILQPFDFLADLVPIVLHHHERWDGRGYPAGLQGEAIPLGARILAVCDTWHSLVCDRAYRAGIAPAVAVAELQRVAGTQLDARLVESLIDLVATPEERDAAEALHRTLLTAPTP